ncbi:Nej1p Ecym_3131 [Eremothecium cymbalariae DBVPG|uniref:Uncharacterized protein n=1 Tax=Eremothecium cymbalariae (strain CBS 270.75 / DBVPG 7215 / KCTC 17166 / NRRL Y-17582) TaxID=931890 RepID=G8JR66_ERECY|nr:Hypothetical protein Ecym_3131 [Eremothecium cymbalariae DBVPG\
MKSEGTINCGRSIQEDKIKWNSTNISNKLSFLGVEVESGLILNIYSPFYDVIRTNFNYDAIQGTSYYEHYEEMSNIILNQINAVLFEIEDAVNLQGTFQLRDGTSISIRLKYQFAKDKELERILSSLSRWQMKNMILLVSMNEDLMKMMIQKDMAIEFLGYTAKEYGGHKLIRRWAPEGSKNYDTLTKLKPDRWKRQWAEGCKLTFEGQVSGLLAQNVNILNTIKEDASDTNAEFEDTSMAEDYRSEFMEQNMDSDSFLEKLSEENLSDTST